MSSKTPTEIWHIILKYSISVPLFFDPDPVKTYGIDILRQYAYELPYWQSERTRNSLRRVSRNWNKFLLAYGHRFIRLDDVVHRRVPTSALPLAIRIDIDGGGECLCKEYCRPEGRFIFWDVMREVWAAAPFLSYEDAEKAKPVLWNVEIVKGWVSDESSHFTLLRSRAPDLKVMISQELTSYDSSTALPQTLIMLLAEPDQYRQSLDLGGLTFLTTLHIEVTSLGPIMNEMDLPSLRHLSIDIPWYEDQPIQDDLYHVVQRIGPQLYTFHFHHPLLEESIKPRLWEVLPIVESIQLPYMWKDCKIPSSHPLQAVQIGVEFISDVVERDTQDMALARYIPYIPERRLTIKMDTAWNETVFADHIIHSMCFYDYCLDRCTRLIDVHGDTFVDYIVFLITAFWKQPGRIYRQAMTQSEYFNTRF